jgi:Uma2 family endonuclease
MATATAAPPAFSPAHARTVYRFSVEQYHRMIEAGILTATDRCELLDGWIVPKMTHQPPHDSAIARLNRRLTRLLSDEWVIRVQAAITLATSEPEPDLAVVTGPEDLYDQRHPFPRDIALLIEVADSSLLSDRRDKGALYARARIPEYWIVNLVSAQVEVYTQPRSGKNPAYRQHDVHDSQDLVPLVLAGHSFGSLPVRELLP